MRTIEECINDLKNRRDWLSVEEVESVFDEILEIDKSKKTNIINKLKERLEEEKSGSNISDVGIGIEIALYIVSKEY